MILLNNRIFNKIQLYVNGKSIYFGTIDEFAERGHLSAIILFPEQYCSKNAFCWSARNGYLNVVKWLHYHHRDTSYIAIDYAAMNGHLDIVKWLLINSNEGMGIDALFNAISFKHFNTTKFLYNIFTDKEHKFYHKIMNIYGSTREYYYAISTSNTIINHATNYSNKIIIDWLKEQQSIKQN